MNITREEEKEKTETKLNMKSNEFHKMNTPQMNESILSKSKEKIQVTNFNEIFGHQINNKNTHNFYNL